GNADIGRIDAMTIIGVVKDFHFESLKQPVSHLALHLANSTYAATYKLNTSNLQSLMGEIEKIWNSMESGREFSYVFMDNSFQNVYRSEQQVGSIAINFSLLAIFIACLGLFGLVTFIIERRIKEISIRRILGA